jgi:hypothetical protein
MDSQVKPRDLEIKYWNKDMSFVVVCENGKAIGLPILMSHYRALYVEINKEELNNYLANLTTEEWDRMHLSSILDWRGYGIIR